MLERWSRGQKFLYLWDTMGLGKTIQALVFANSILSRRALILCPGSLRLNWLIEAHKWHSTKTLAIQSSKALLDFERSLKTEKTLQAPKLPHYPPVICGLEHLAGNNNLLNFLKGYEPDLIIVDEAHKLRGISSKTSKKCFELFNQYKHIPTLLLSGTPVLNSALDMFKVTQHLSRLYPDCLDSDLNDVFKNFVSYADLFTHQFHSDYGIVYKGIKNPDEFKACIDAFDFRLRRRKEDVLDDLPDKQYFITRLQISPEFSLDKEQLEILSRLVVLLEQGRERELLKEGIQIQTLKRMLGEAKAASKATLGFLTELYRNAENNCLVIFFYHKSVRDILRGGLAAELNLKPSDIVVHDGDAGPKEKQKSIEAFQSGRASVLLAQVDSAVGYTATRASDAVFIEYPWLPAIAEQAADRLHRIGQKNAVTIYYLAADLDIEAGFIKALIKRQKEISNIIEN